MSEPKYICVSGYNRFTEDELHQCPKCGEYSCPTCGGEIVTIEKYDKDMKENSYDSND